MMNLQTLIDQWLKEHHPTATISEGTICLPIEQPIKKFGLKRQTGDVWYLCRITDDRVRFYKPASEVFGAEAAAIQPDFFDIIAKAIKFYDSYVP